LHQEFYSAISNIADLQKDLCFTKFFSAPSCQHV